MTWAGGLDSNTSGGFVLTDDNSVEHPVIYSAKTIGNISNPVFRAVADELHNQAGSATGTVTVTIA
jgi:cobalamin biosynthesis protein CobD/CbiB